MKVKSDAGGGWLGDSVNVTAADGTYTETLQFFGGNEPSFAGAFERTGTYTLTVKRNNYKTYTSNPVTVGKDACYVIPQTLTVSLQPK